MNESVFEARTNILWFDVPMNKALRMEISDSGYQLPENPQCLSLLKFAAFCDVIEKISGGCVLHYYAYRFVVLNDIDESDYVFVIEVCHDVVFPSRSFDLLVFLIFLDHLDSHLLQSVHITADKDVSISTRAKALKKNVIAQPCSLSPNPLCFL